LYNEIYAASCGSASGCLHVHLLFMCCIIRVLHEVLYMVHSASMFCSHVLLVDFYMNKGSFLCVWYICVTSHTFSEDASMVLIVVCM